MNFLSLVLGVQSTAIYLMAAKGILNIKIDYAIFADTKAENPETYKYLKYLKNLQKLNNWPPIVITSNGSIIKHIQSGKSPSLPLFTNGKSGGLLNRQCTSYFKINPVKRTIKKLYGLKTRQKAPLTKIYLGISSDEIRRLKYSEVNWIIKSYPLVGYESTKNDFIKYSNNKISRADCLAFFKKYNFKTPPKSSCFFCPYQKPEEWQKLKKETPKLFELAAQLEDKIQENPKLKNSAFFSRELKPLRKADFKKDQLNAFENCDSGFCGS